MVYFLDVIGESKALLVKNLKSNTATARKAVCRKIKTGLIDMIS